MESAPQEVLSCIVPLQNPSSKTSDVLGLGATSLRVHGACTNTASELGCALPQGQTPTQSSSAFDTDSLDETSSNRESSHQSEAVDYQHIVHLPDVHAANDWRQQKRRFLHQHDHLTEMSSDDSLLDQEFAVHLLNVHSKFCIQPSCTFGLVDGHIPAKSNSSDRMHLAQINNSGIVQQGTVLDHIRPQFSTEAQEDSSDGWISEQESPDVSHDHATDTIAIEIKIEKEDAVDEDAQGIASGGWISRDVSSDVSHDYATDGMSKQIKTEKEDEASEVTGKGGHFGGERQGKCGLAIETTCRIVLKKLDIKRIPVKCQCCSKALYGNRFKYILNSREEICPDNCDSCMKEVSCTKSQTGQATSPKVAIPTRDGSGYSAGDRMSTSCNVMSEEPGRECHDSGEFHKGYTKHHSQNVNRAGHLADDNHSIKTAFIQNHTKDSTQPIPSISRIQKRSYKCEWCPKAYSTIRKLKRHIKTHTGGRPHKCNLCSKAFKEKYHLQLHMATHSTERPFKCNLCPKVFKVKQQLLKHKRTHTGEFRERPFECNLCSKAFFYNHYLTKHMKTHTSEKPFKCNQCSKAFMWEQGLHRHVKTHSGEGHFKCNICLKICTKEKLLQRHMKRHTGERPYKCTICSKAFGYQKNLESHFKEHSKDGRFKCTVCFKTFMKKAVLCIHMRTHIGEKQYECKECLKQFCDERNFKRHLLMHSGERTLKCNVCTKAFYRIDNLKRHMQSHIGLKTL